MQGCGNGINLAHRGMWGQEEAGTRKGVGMGSTQHTERCEGGILQGYGVGLCREVRMRWALTRDTQPCGDGINPAHTGIWGQGPAGIWAGMPITDPTGTQEQDSTGANPTHTGTKGQELLGINQRLEINQINQLQRCGDGIQEGLIQEPQGHGNRINWAPTGTCRQAPMEINPSSTGIDRIPWM